MSPDLQKLLDNANELERFADLCQMSFSSKLHLRNAACLVRLAVEREDDRRKDGDDSSSS